MLVIPADQSLCTDDFFRIYVELWLQMNDEFILCDSFFKIGYVFAVFVDFFIHVGCEEIYLSTVMLHSLTLCNFCKVGNCICLFDCVFNGNDSATVIQLVISLLRYAGDFIKKSCKQIGECFLIIGFYHHGKVVIVASASLDYPVLLFNVVADHSQDLVCSSVAINVIYHFEIFHIKMNESIFEIFWIFWIEGTPHVVPVEVPGYGIMIEHFINFFF